MQAASPSINIFYDSHCGLCARTVCWLKALDWMGRLRLVDFQDAELRSRYAPDILYEDLDRAMHIRLPNGAIHSGFPAFRRLCLQLPPLWIIAPFLYLPGVKIIGDRLYAHIAEKRKKCTHESCSAR